ncbi:hypothetical protein OC835_008045, partial [Tilletia horrida]
AEESSANGSSSRQAAEANGDPDADVPLYHLLELEEKAEAARKAVNGGGWWVNAFPGALLNGRVRALAWVPGRAAARCKGWPRPSNKTRVSQPDWAATSVHVALALRRRGPIALSSKSVASSSCMA